MVARVRHRSGRFAVLALVLAGCTAASEDGVTVQDAAVGESVNGINAGVYARIEAGGVPDSLVAVSSPAAEKGSLHVMASEGGMMTMQPVPAFALPAGAILALSPGARHGMLEGLLSPLAVGDTIDVTFTFASGAERTVRAPVRSLLDLRGR